MLELAPAVLGASSRVEIHLYSDTGASRDDIEAWRDIEALTDRRLLRRIVVSHRGEMSVDLRTLARGFRGTGWAVRATEHRSEGHPLEFVVIDREVAWVGGGNQSSRQLNRQVQDAGTIDHLVNNFRHLWAMAVPANSDFLYDAPETLARPGGDWDELLAELDRRPESVYSLEPRKFEQLVAEILTRQRYRVTLTPASRDGGRDILLASPTDVGDFLYLVECKRFAQHNHVGVEIVRQLYGVVEAQRATAGIVVTTSSFSKPAQEFRGTVGTRMALRDYENLKLWIREARNNRAG